MANFKRNKPRLRTSRSYSHRAGNRRFGRHHVFWMCHWPAWWDIIFDRRPNRRRAAAIKRKILCGMIDADDAAWPVSKKPHTYYW